jgi:hypothetical protein
MIHSAGHHTGHYSGHKHDVEKPMGLSLIVPARTLHKSRVSKIDQRTFRRGEHTAHIPPPRCFGIVKSLETPAYGCWRFCYSRKGTRKRTSGAARQSSVVWRLRRPSSRGHQRSLPMHPVTLVSPMEIARAMTPSHSLGQVRRDRLLAIHFPRQTRSAPVQGRNALEGNTGSGPVPEGLASPERRSRRDRLATTLHT